MAKKDSEAEVQFEEGDDNMVVDFDDVEDPLFEALPRGKYPCILAALTFAYSQASGNPMWTWELEVDGGDYSGRKLFFHTVFKGNGLPRTKKTLQRVIPEIVKVGFKPSEVADEGALLGMKLIAQVDVGRYEGVKNNNVKDLFPGEGSESFM